MKYEKYDLGDIVKIKNNSKYKDEEFFIKRNFNNGYYGISIIDQRNNKPYKKEFKCKEECLEIVANAKIERFLIFNSISPYDTYELEFKDRFGNIRDKVVGSIDNFAPCGQIVVRRENGLYINEVKNIIYMKNISTMRDFVKLEKIKEDESQIIYNMFTEDAIRLVNTMGEKFYTSKSRYKHIENKN